MRCAWIGRGSGFVAMGGFCFLPLEGEGSSLSGVMDCDSCCGIAVVGLCLLSVFACCQSLAQGLEPLLWEIAFGELLCGDVLWLYGVFVMHQFAPLCLFVADSRFAAYPGLPRFRGGCCGWWCGFLCSLLGDAASGISARLLSNCLTEPLIFPMRI